MHGIFAEHIITSMLGRKQFSMRNNARGARRGEPEFQCASARHYGAFGSNGERAISKKGMMDLYLAASSRMKDFQLKYISSLTGSKLAVDHTYYTCKFVREDFIQIFDGLYGIMNEYGQLIAWIFTKSESIGEIGDFLQKVK